MMTNMPEVNSIGGVGGWGVPGASFGGGFGGGIGAFGLFGLIGLDTLRGRRGGEGDGCCEGPGRNELATLAAIANAKDTTVAEGRGLAAAICEAKAQSAAQSYAAAIQLAGVENSVKDQLTAQAIVNDSRFDALTLAGVTQTAAILARINQTEIDSLRDQLHAERRHGDVQATKIEINNSANAVQAQLQAQAQWQQQRDFDHIRRFDALFFAQSNKAAQDTINFGTMAASGNQANTQQNAKA